MNIHIKEDEHVFIAGMTGSGKSVLAEVYLAGFENVAKLDTKGEVFERRAKGQPVWRGLVEGKDYTVIERLEDLNYLDTKKVIYAPAPHELEHDYYDAFLKWCYDRHNTQVWIDELMEVAPSPQKYPYNLKAIYTRGRSRNVTIWALSQRTLDIPAIVISQTTHFFIFNLNQPQDRKKLADTTGILEFYEKPQGYNFWYFKNGADHAIKGRLKL